MRKKVSIEQKHELTGGKRRGAFYRDDACVAQLDYRWVRFSDTAYGDTV